MTSCVSALFYRLIIHSFVWATSHQLTSAEISEDFSALDTVTEASEYKLSNIADSNRHATFYRAMHFSAKRGIAIACRLSVRPSVCLSVCLSVCNVGEL